MTSAQVDEPIEPGSAAWWTAHAERLARRRPRAGGLTVERVVDTALRLVDAEGFDGLTVRRLAAALDTSSATLYRHVASVDELAVLVIDRVLGEVRYPDPDLPARDRVVAMSGELRRVLLEHPGVVPALPAAPLLGPNAQRGSEHGLVNLLDMGLPVEVAVSGYLALIDYVLGSVFFDSASEGHRPAPARGDGARTSAERMDPATIELPHSDEVFRQGLETFLDGLVGRATRGSRRR